MKFVDDNRNGTGGLPSPVAESPEPPEVLVSTQASESPLDKETEASQPKFATRTEAGAAEGISKSKLILLACGLAVAVLFFVFAAVVGKSPKRSASVKPTSQSQQAAEKQAGPPKGSVTPVMDTPRAAAPDNSGGQVGPGDIRRTRSLDASASTQPMAAKTAVASSLGAVPSFADTQQRWEDPVPYNGTPPAEIPQTEQNTLKEPSLIFVRSQTQGSGSSTSRGINSADIAPELQLPEGTRILAKLKTEVSSAVSLPVVAEVEYTYAIGDQVIIPAGARFYGDLVQATPSGLVNIKFSELELLDKPKEKIEAVAAGLDLGPIKGAVTGKNTGKTFLARAGAGIGSVLAELAGNNNSAAFSEDDMLRERLAENIGTAGDSEVMSLSANSHIIVTVPANQEIYVIFSKSKESASELHRLNPAAQ